MKVSIFLPSFSPCSPVIPQVFRNGLEVPRGADSTSSAVYPPPAVDPLLRIFSFQARSLGGVWGGEASFLGPVCSTFEWAGEPLEGGVVSLTTHPESLLVGDHRFHQPLPECSDVSSLYFAPSKRLTVGSNGYLSIIHLIFMGMSCGLYPRATPEGGAIRNSPSSLGERYVYIGSGVANSVSPNRLVEISPNGLSGSIAIIYWTLLYTRPLPLKSLEE